MNNETLTSDVIITEKDANFIYSHIGAPFVEREEIELSFEDLKEYIIRPALWKYFTYFPILTKTQYSVNNTKFDIAYPTATTYGVGGVQVAKYNNTISPTLAGMPMVGYNVFNSTAMINTNTNRGYGTRYGLSSSMASFSTDKATNDAFANVFQIKHFVDRQELRLIEVYSNMPGTLEVTFCELSNDCSNVAFQRKVDFLNYAGSKLVQYIADLRSMISSDFPTEFDLTAKLERADKFIEDIEEKWNNSSNAVVVR